MKKGELEELTKKQQNIINDLTSALQAIKDDCESIENRKEFQTLEDLLESNSSTKSFCEMRLNAITKGVYLVPKYQN